MRMNWLARAVALPILLTLSAPAVADSDGGPGTWTLITTVEGCTAYWEYFAEYETKAVMLKRNRFSWKGSGCRKGKLIAGEGILTKTIDDDGIYPHTFKGRMVDGVLDGPVTYIDALNETHAWTYRMGCIVYGNQVDRNCTPRERLATRPTPTNAAFAQGEGLDRAFLVGRWSNLSDCSEWMEFRGDGTFTSPILQGNWDLSGNRMTIRGTGFEYHTTFRKIDDRTLESTDDSGKSGQTSRCSSLPNANGESEADARYDAALLEYEQKLAAQRKAVADYEAAERQMAADKAAAAAKASAAQEQYARERAEYEAQLSGQPVAAQGGGTLAPPPTGGPGGSNVPPLRPTAALEAHNPANEASQCLDLIIKRDFEAHGASSIMGAVFRNSCPFPVETRWCIGANRCATGYDNLATMPAKDDRGISYDQPAPGTIIETRWAGCRLGFAYRPDFAGTLHYACK